MATLNLKKKKFIDEDNLKQIIKIGISFGERLNSIETSLISEYDSTKTYIIGEACYHDNYIYKCNSTATGTWNPDRWTLIGDDITELTLDEIKAMLGLTTEQLTTLSSIILDSEVRLDKTYSSSKIYSSIQDAIDTAKAYTLAEIGKASGASYKIASSTSDMTDEKVIYLLQNGSTYDMYIVDSGTPTRIGDVSIDLSDYYTKTEINNDFLKKTDATSAYATKVELNDKADATALDDKVDKTDIIDNLTSTDNNKPLSANQGKILDNKKLNKADADKIEIINADNVNIKDFILEKCIDENKVYHITARSNCTDLPKVNSNYYMIVEKIGSFTCKVIAMELAYKDSIYMCTYRIDNAKWTSWKKVCTTSIEDVPVTNIAPSDTTTFVGFKGNANCNYCVKNGICYVSIWNVKIASTGKTIRTGVILPKVANNRAGVLMTGSGDATCHAFAFVIEGTNELCFDVKDTNTFLYGSFSYPVAES